MTRLTRNQMKRQMITRVIGLALAATLAAPFIGMAAAQTPETPQTQLPPLPKMEIGQLVWVTTSDGAERKGVISSLTSTSIAVSGAAGTQALNFNDVVRIAKKDSDWTGFYAGATLALMPAWVIAEYSSYHRKFDVGVFVYNWAIGAATYGGIGMLIDHAIVGQQTIWENHSTRTMTMTPIVAKRGLGVGGSITWK